MLTICGVDYYSEKEMTKRYPLSKSWFEKARRTKEDIPFTKLGGRIYYPAEAIDNWFKDYMQNK